MKREGGREGSKEEGAKHIQGPSPMYHDQHRAFTAATACIPEHCSAPFSLAALSFEQNFDTAVGNSAD